MRSWAGVRSAVFRHRAFWRNGQERSSFREQGTDVGLADSTRSAGVVVIDDAARGTGLAYYDCRHSLDVLGGGVVSIERVWIAR